MKKYLIFVTLIIFTFSVTSFSGGDGSESNPYQVSTCSDLQDVSNDANNVNYYEITQDLDCSGNLIDPIGTDASGFKGYFNGNGYSISNLQMSRENSDYVGLFGDTLSVDSSTPSVVSNFTISNADITGDNYVGVVAGASFETVFRNIMVINSTVEARSKAGGFSGQLGGLDEFDMTQSVVAEKIIVENTDINLLKRADDTNGGFDGGMFTQDLYNAGGIRPVEVKNIGVIRGSLTRNGDTESRTAAFAGRTSDETTISSTYIAATSPIDFSGTGGNINDEYLGDVGSSVTAQFNYFSSNSDVTSSSYASELSDSSIQGSNAETNMDFDFTNIWVAPTGEYPKLQYFENSAPSSPANPTPVDGATEVSTNPTLSVDVSDPDGDSMDVTFYDASDDTQIGSTQTSISNGGTASVTWNSLNDGTSYNWYAVADDGSETTQSSTFSFTTNYAPNSPVLVNPSDGDTRLNTDVTLQVDVSDTDGDSMDVSFYDASDDSLLGTDTNVASGGRAEYSWTGLDYGTNYNWYAVADDGSVTTQSSTWGFKTTHLEEITNNDAHTGSFWIENDAIRWVSSGLELILRNVNLVEASSPGPVGSVWIENTSIHWINELGEERSYEGPVIDASTAAPNGYTWIENDLIHYVDQSGDERVINGE